MELQTFLAIPQAILTIMSFKCLGWIVLGTLIGILFGAAPGNAATCTDGYPMAKKGLAGDALGHSIFSSWLGSTFSAVALPIFAPLIASVAIKFGPPKYFAVAIMGLVCITGVSTGSIQCF
jgi:putative tricarboxylic transport membrane protein